MIPSRIYLYSEKGYRFGSCSLNFSILFKGRNIAGFFIKIIPLITDFILGISSKIQCGHQYHLFCKSSPSYTKNFPVQSETKHCEGFQDCRHDDVLLLSNILFKLRAQSIFKKQDFDKVFVRSLEYKLLLLTVHCRRCFH